MIITLYRTDTGEVLRQLESDDPEFLALNIADGESAFWGQVSGSSHYITDGEPVAFPARPGDWAVWDWASHDWTDPRDADWFAAELAEAKASALAQITAMRGQARLVYITDLPGQDMLYSAKYAKAVEYLSDADPDPHYYRLIYSEVGENPGATASTIDEVVQVFMNLNYVWEVAASILDPVFYDADAIVKASSTIAAVDAVLDALPGQIESAHIQIIDAIYAGAPS